MTQQFDPFEPDGWTAAPGCEAFEQAIAMRERAALAPQAVPVLDAHLAACEACRAHAAQMADVDAALTAHRGGEQAETTAQRAHDRLYAGIRRYRRRAPWTIVLAGIAGLGATAFVSAFFDSRPLHIAGLVGAFAGYLVLLGGAYLVARRRHARLLAHHDVVAAYRGELEQRLRTARATRWVWPVVIAIQLQLTLTGDATAHARVATNVLLTGLAVGAFAWSLATARRTQRELAGLE